LPPTSRARSKARRFNRALHALVKLREAGHDFV
jgi:hypothetical protein